MNSVTYRSLLIALAGAWYDELILQKQNSIPHRPVDAGLTDNGNF